MIALLSRWCELKNVWYDMCIFTAWWVLDFDDFAKPWSKAHTDPKDIQTSHGKMLLFRNDGFHIDW